MGSDIATIKTMMKKDILQNLKPLKFLTELKILYVTWALVMKLSISTVHFLHFTSLVYVLEK